MKIHSSIILLVILASCGQANSGKKDNSDAAQAPPQIPFDLSTLPAEWINLTKTDSGLVIYSSCDAGNMRLKIQAKELFFYGQQEEDYYPVLSSLQVAGDTMVIQTKMQDSEERQTFRMVWVDKQKQLIRLFSSFSTGKETENLLVVGGQAEKYPKVDQPCRECWGDECDDLK